jgi:hypothetical protein
VHDIDLWLAQLKHLILFAKLFCGVYLMMPFIPSLYMSSNSKQKSSPTNPPDLENWDKGRRQNVAIL